MRFVSLMKMDFQIKTFKSGYNGSICVTWVCRSKLTPYLKVIC